MDQICFAIFVWNYYLDYENKNEIDSQPDVLGEKDKEIPHGISKTLTKSLFLMSSYDKLNFRSF